VKQIFEYIQSFVTIGLVLAGIGGVSYHMFKENGWLHTALGTIWDFQLSNPVIAIPVTIAVLFIGKLWIDKQRAKGYTSKLPNVLIYVVMAAGVFFIYQFVTHGPAL
jgi:membrane protein insertase Oxa1/YidC/SpoIIIJ